MKVMFLNRVFPPADGATGQLLSELATGLAKAGFEVTVLTSQSNPPAPAREIVNGVEVVRVCGLRFTRASLWRRALSYCALYPAMLFRALRLPRADVVVTMTDPPLLLTLGPLLKWTKGCRLVHWAQDVYPEVAEEIGVLRSKSALANLCRRLSTWALNRHERIVAVGHCMKERLVARGVDAASIEVIPNWAPRGLAACSTEDGGAFRREHGLEGKFVVMYSGNLGLAHPFEAILGAAEELMASQPQIAFVFVGAGPQLARLRGQAGTRRLENVRFLPPQPHAALAQSLAAANLHLASMHDSLCGLVVPSKVYGILAARRPCIFLGPRESEAAREIQQHDCGEAIDAATGAKLAASIVEWMNDPQRLARAGERARRSAEAAGVERALRCFERVLRETSAPQLVAAEARASSDNLTPQQMPSSTAQ